MTVMDRVRLGDDLRRAVACLPGRGEALEMTERELYTKVLRRLGYAILAALDRHYGVR